MGTSRWERWLTGPSRWLAAGSCTALAVALVLGGPSAALAAISWDAGGDTQWWFDYENWSESEAMRLPPTSDGDNLPETTNDIGVTDAQINIGTGPWDLGEGVVYDPANDPNFATAQTLVYPAGPYGPQVIEDLYISRADADLEGPTGTNLLTIKGDLTVADDVQLGRSSGVEGVASTGIIHHKGGRLWVLSDIDLGQTDTSNPGFGNGTYEYFSGTLDNSTDSGTGRFRLSAGGSTGSGGVGTFIMHNPDDGGHVRARELLIAAFGGQNGFDPDGIETGVAVMEWHFENGGTRPFQVEESVILSNGLDADGQGTRSSRLNLVLDEAPTVDEGVPQNLGLIDVDFLDSGFGVLTAPGGNPGSLGVTFSSVDNPLDPYEQGEIVSATFGSTIYNWTISYQGNITWIDEDDSIVNSISGSGGMDIVLIGDSIEVLPGTPGDYNDDGTVDSADYTVWLENLGSTGGLPNENPGASTPGVIDFEDYTFWKSAFGASGSASGSAIPEPASLSLLMLMLSGAALVRCRKV